MEARPFLFIPISIWFFRIIESQDCNILKVDLPTQCLYNTPLLHITTHTSTHMRKRERKECVRAREWEWMSSSTLCLTAQVVYGTWPGHALPPILSGLILLCPSSSHTAMPLYLSAEDLSSSKALRSTQTFFDWTYIQVLVHIADSTLVIQREFGVFFSCLFSRWISPRFFICSFL